MKLKAFLYCAIIIANGATLLHGAVDADGWTIFNPTASNTDQAISEETQPGTRIIYIGKATSPVTLWNSSTTYANGNIVLHPTEETAVNGNHVTDAFWQSDGSTVQGIAPGNTVAGWTTVADPGVVYYWNGSQVVDASGNTFGADPFNPQGIQSFYSYGTTKSSVSAWGNLREGYPDWCLFKRGETWTAGVDLFAGIKNYQGRSSSKPFLHGAYGSLTLARPRFLHTPGGITDRYGNHTSNFLSLNFNGQPTYGNMSFVSLSFEPLDPVPEDRGSGFGVVGSWDGNIIAGNILFEDIKVNGFEGNAFQWLGTEANGQLPFNFNLTLRRCIVVNTWAGDHHNQGMYIYNLNNLILEECIFDRNGYKEDPRINENARDIYSRNFYLNYYSQMGVTFDNTISCNGGSGGPQMRCGGKIQKSLILNEGYWYSGAHADREWEKAQVGRSTIVRDNVMFKWSAHGTTDNRSHPGWGFNLQGNAFGGEVYDNIISGQHELLNGQNEPSLYALKIIGSEEDGYFAQSNRIYNNISYLAGPLETQNSSKLRKNIFKNNVVVSNNHCVDHEDTSDTIFSGNRYYTDNSQPFRTNDGSMTYSDFLNTNVCKDDGTSTVAPLNQAMSSENWSDPDRSVKSYMESLGYTVSTNDGVRELMAQCEQQRKGSWRSEFTALSVVNYIRQGFGMSAVSDYVESLSESLASQQVIAYPNPARDQVTFLFPNVTEAVSVAVFVYNFNGESVGRIYDRINFTLPKVYWNTWDRAPGVYIAHVMVDGKLLEKKKLAIIK